MTNNEIKQLTTILAKIKTPKDIKALHDVRIMLDIIDCGNLLSNHLHEFQDEFIQSFAMSADDVLSAIPHNKWKSYKMSSKYYDLFNMSYHYIFYIIKNGVRQLKDSIDVQKQIAHVKTEIESNIPGLLCFKENPYKCRNNLQYNFYFEFKLDNLNNLQDKLYFINKTDKCFYINHKKKTIELNWSLWTPNIIKHYFTKKTHYSAYKNLPISHFNMGDSFLSEDKNIITYTCIYKDIQSFYIPQDSDWYSKRRTHEYENVTQTLTVTHSFCMNTNTYLGCTQKLDKSGGYSLRHDGYFNIYGNEIYNNELDIEKIKEKITKIKSSFNIIENDIIILNEEEYNKHYNIVDDKN